MGARHPVVSPAFVQTRAVYELGAVPAGAVKLAEMFVLLTCAKVRPVGGFKALVSAWAALTVEAAEAR
jgi:hypothetical protein